MIQFHQKNHLYILGIERIQEQTLEEHQHKYLSKKKFDHLKIPAAVEKCR